MRLRPDYEAKVVRLDLQNWNHRRIGMAPTGGANSPPDSHLFDAVKHGDAEALRTLYDRYSVKVYKIAKRLFQDEQVIQEIIQDVFTRIWTTHAFDPNGGEFSHWLAVVARRVAIDHVRKHRRDSYPLSPTDLRATVDDTERLTNNRMLRSDLLNAMSTLDSDQRRVLQLAYFDGYTLTEISSILGIPLGTVKTRLHKGLRKMRIALNDWTEEVQR